MKNRVCYGVPALALLLVQLSFSAHAFTLGNLHGSAVIGRPLDVNIQVQFGTGEVVSSDCVTAEAFYADIRQPAVKVSVLPTAGGSGLATVHLRSSTAINEPVVTLEVSATCGSSTRRSYVLLADFPQMASPVAALQSVPVDVSAAPVLVLPTLAPSESGSATVPSQALRVGNAKPVTTQVAPRKTSVKPANIALATPPAEKSLVRKLPVRASGKSVLKLDPSDFLSDRIDLLDSTTLFAPTEDALRHSRQITSLEGDVKTLRALAASNDARMSDLTAKLQQAQENQMPSWLVYAFAGLVALVLACLAAVLWLWLQLQRRGQEDSAPSWWRGQEGARDEGPPTELLTQTRPRMSAEPTVPAPAMATKSAAQGVAMAEQKVSTPTSQVIPVEAQAAVPIAELDIDLESFLPEGSFQGAFEISTAGAPFELNSIRHISVEPILDIRQQAEFFVSLGQADRALHILKKQIEESSESNPLVYLDLIMLYHSLGLKAEFRERRNTFHQLFNGMIPDFPVFLLEGRDLESYSEVLASLVSLWPGIDALAFLSACIFRDVNAFHEGTFDLAAFRDLLMLHALVEALLVTPTTLDETTEPVTVAPVTSATQAVAPAARSPARMLDLDFSVPTEPNQPDQKN